MSAEYRVVVTREDRNWLADVPALQGAHTFARDLEALDRYVREVVVLAADLPDEAADGLDLVWEYRTGDADMDERLRALREARRDLESSRADIARRTEDLVRQQSERFSVRDLAALLGLSRSRVQQMAHPPRRA